MELLVLPLIGLGGLWVLDRTIARSDVGMALLLVTVVSGAAFPHPQVGVAGISIHLADVVFALLLGAALARLVRAGRPTPLQLVLGVLLLTMLWSFVRGLPSFGIESTVNSVRDPFYVFGGALYFTTVEMRRDVVDRLGRWWIGASVALTVLAVLRWGANAAGLSGGVFGDGEDLRVLASAGALVITFGLVFTLLAQRRTGASRHLGLLAAGLLLTVVVLQHRTVWIVTILMVAVLLVRRRSLPPRAVASIAAVVLIMTVLFSTVLASDRPLQEDLNRSATSVDTFEWRLAGWTALFEQNGLRGWEEVVLGRPYGTGWDRRVGGLLITVSPHNFYIEMLLRTGAVGLTCLLALHVVPLVKLGRRTSRRGGTVPFGIEREALFVVMCALPVYYLSYAAPTATAALIGLAAAAAGAPATEPYPEALARRHRGGAASASRIPALNRSAIDPAV